MIWLSFAIIGNIHPPTSLYLRMNYPWLFTMAWRDSRRNRSRLLLFMSSIFMSSIVLGIAALVAINSFGDSMQGDIELEAKKLLDFFGGPPIPHH